LINYLLPELSATVGFDQRNPHHDLTVDQHTLEVLRTMSQLSNDPDLRLAALFHDAGKPESFWQDEEAPEGGGGHFYEKKLDDGTTVGKNHDEEGARLVREAMSRLRYPNKRIDRVEALVRNHMWKYFDTPKGARRFLASVGGDVKMAQDLLLLRQADASGKRGGTMSDFDAQNLMKAQKLLTHIYEESQAVTVKDLAIGGKELMDLGFKGPEIGRAQRWLLEQVIDDPSVNTKAGLMNLLEGNRHPVESKVLERQAKKKKPGKGNKPQKDKRKKMRLKMRRDKKKWEQTDPYENLELVDEGYEEVGRSTYQVVEVTQPRYKWSYGHTEHTNPGPNVPGTKLLMWRVDPKHGRPHHIEVTGNNFYKYAQGRIYIDEKDYIEILVWSDRGDPDLQDQAVEAVEDWIKNNLNRESDIVTWQSEGINWGNLGRDPSLEEINKHYFYDPDDDVPYAMNTQDPVKQMDSPDTQEAYDEVTPEELEAYKNYLRSKPLHQMSWKDWEDYEQLMGDEIDYDELGMDNPSQEQLNRYM